MLVKMINGTFGYREKTENGYAMPIICKTVNDPPFEVDKDVAADLIANNAAVIVESDLEPAGEPEPESAEYSPDMTANQLKAVMNAHGLTVKPRMSKPDMIAALDEYFSESDDGEDLPDLSAEVPT